MFPKKLILAFLQISFLSILAKPAEQIPTDSSPVRTYHCNSSVESTYVQEAKSNLKRFVRYRNELYFVFDKKIIFTSLPTLEKDEKNRSFFTHYNFYEQIAEEDALPVSVDPKVIGHLYDSDAVTTQEIHSVGRSDSQSGELCASEQAYELAFSGKLAKRDHPVDLNVDLQRHLNKKRNCKISYVQALKDQTGLTVFGFSGETRKLSVEQKVGDDFREAFRLNFSSNVRFFVVSKFENEPKFFKLNLIWVDASTFEVNYESLLVYKPGLIEKQTHFRVGLDELFSCRTKATNPRQFKGVYFDRTTEKFYVFIKRFYLQLGRDLVSEFFLLTDLAYAENAHDLEYDGEEPKEFAVFSDQANVWVKNYPNKSYLMPSSKIFEIDTVSRNKLTIKKPQDSSSLVTCRANILVFERRYSYCFENDKYYLLQDTQSDLQATQWTKERFEIQSIFSSFSLIHWDGQSVKLTFNYKNDQFVMMTSRYLYVFDYRDFEVQKSNATIRFLNKYGSRRTLNCLFVGSLCSQLIAAGDVDQIFSATPTTREVINLTTKRMWETTQTPKPEVKPPNRTVVFSILLMLVLLGLLYLIKRLMYGKKEPNEKTQSNEPAKAAPSGSAVLPVAPKKQNQLKSSKALSKSSIGSSTKESLNSGKSLASSKTLAAAKQSKPPSKQTSKA